MPTVTDYLIARLRELGLEHVFTVPGDTAAPFLEGPEKAPGLTRAATIVADDVSPV